MFQTEALKCMYNNPNRNVNMNYNRYVNILLSWNMSSCMILILALSEIDVCVIVFNVCPHIHKIIMALQESDVYVFIRNGMNEDAFQQCNHLANIIGLTICLKSRIP